MVSGVQLQENTARNLKKVVSSDLFRPKPSKYNPALDLCQLTVSQKKIFEELWVCHKDHNAIPSVALIARRSGISPRTVTRAFNRFNDLDLIYRYQPGIKKKNVYRFHPQLLAEQRRAGEYLQTWNMTAGETQLYFSGLLLSEIKVPRLKKQKTWQSEYVRRDKGYINNNIIYTPIPTARAVGGYKKRSLEIKNEKHSRLAMAIDILKQQKDMIRKYKGSEELRQVLHKPEFALLLFNKTIQEIANNIQATLHDQLKLIAFPESAVKFAWSSYNSKKGRIDDVVAYIATTANKYCQKNNIEPDWPWYYELCEVLSINVPKRKIQSRSSPVMSDKAYYGENSGNNHKQTISLIGVNPKAFLQGDDSQPNYDRVKRRDFVPSRPLVPKLSKIQKIQELEKDIQVYQNALQSEKFKKNSTEYCIEAIEKRLAHSRAELELLNKQID